MKDTQYKISDEADENYLKSYDSLTIEDKAEIFSFIPEKLNSKTSYLILKLFREIHLYKSKDTLLTLTECISNEKYF